MECNRDEAIKAKNLAERSMGNKDFTTARRFALKAQRLYPNLEDISKIILVCDVLCSEKILMYRKEENDWYAILKIEPTADEATIRKQYRKFGLSIHPDKNKFPGAADAFHLVNEAHRTLLDHKSRFDYDLKLKVARSLVKKKVRTQSSKKSKTARDPQEQNVNENVASQCTNQQDQQNLPNVNIPKTFWTACTGCLSKFMYYEEIMGKRLHCRVCKAVFTALQTNLPCPPDPSPQGEAASLNRQASQYTHKKFDPRVAVQRNPDNKKNSESEDGLTSNVSEDPNAEGKTSNVESMFDEMGSAQENLCSNMTFQRDGEDNHLEPKNGHIPIFNKSIKAKIVTSANVDSMSGKLGSTQENSCTEMKFERDGEDSPSEPKDGHIPPLNESLNAETETSHVNTAIEGSTHLDKWGSGIQKKRQRRGNITDSGENSCGNGVGERLKTSSTKESLIHKDNSVERASGENYCGNGGSVCLKTSSTKESLIHKDNSIERASQDNLDPVPNAQGFYEYPAPDFSNFNDLRARNVFEKGQIWAVYDTLDAMPRFYALITKVFSPNFKVELIWLEPDPDDEEETKWVEEGLPASCGSFRHGNSDVIQELPIFSHLVCWEKGATDATFKVHPRKGETWALYKDWDISWHAHCETKKTYEYEFVEVLSDYDNGVGVCVAFLYTVEGFSCIFRRDTIGTMKSFLIPAKERFRFSHRVQSFKISDNERKGILAGSFELDPASMPFNVTTSADLNHVVMYPRKTHPSTRDVSVDEKANNEGNALTNLRKDEVHEDDAPCFVEVKGNPKIDSTSQDVSELHPNSELEFYDFQENICPNKFHVGQIWAIYCDEDSLPRYYGKIIRVETFPIFNLYVTWFIACPPPEGMVSWVDDEMLTAVGNFELMEDKPQKYSSTDPFSHEVSAEPTDFQDVYAIFPKKDQIWALYKNWNPFLNISDLDDCEYEIVKVVGEDDKCILVSIMNPIKGFKSVFRPQVEGQVNCAVEILKNEILRFSHQIPAFQLTKELGGSLQGFWELDAAALPRHLLNQ